MVIFKVFIGILTIVGVVHSEEEEDDDLLKPNYNMEPEEPSRKRETPDCSNNDEEFGYDVDDLQCSCIGGSKNQKVRSFDGRKLHTVRRNSGSLLSKWTADSSNYPCHYRLQVVAKDNTGGEPVRVHYDWVVLGTWIFNGKFYMNFVIAQDTEGNPQVAVRVNEVDHKLDMSCGYIYIRVYNAVYNCTWKITILTNNLVTLRSSCCPYFFRWQPKGIKTRFQFWVGDIYTDGNAQGICGDCDGNKDNDLRKCPDGPVLRGNTGRNIAAIAESCVDGPQGDEYDGGERLEDLYAEEE